MDRDAILDAPVGSVPKHIDRDGDFVVIGYDNGDTRAFRVSDIAGLRSGPVWQHTDPPAHLHAEPLVQRGTNVVLLLVTPKGNISEVEVFVSYLLTHAEDARFTIKRIAYESSQQARNHGCSGGRACKVGTD